MARARAGTSPLARGLCLRDVVRRHDDRDRLDDARRRRHQGHRRLLGRGDGERRLQLEEIAISLEEFILALFSIEQVVYFGLPFVLLGLASLYSKQEPAWFGWTGVAAGAWNCTVGVVQTFTDRTEFWTHILLPIGVVYVSVWLPTAVFMMWRRVASGPSPPADPEAAAPVSAVASRTPG